MMNLDIIGEELFNKVRSRFSNVTIGDENGTVTNEPKAARFFDFEYKSKGESLGNVSISLSEDEGVVIMYSNDFLAKETQLSQNGWYDFLREIRMFAKKRMLNFDTRDINKSNLNKRDYQFLAKNRTEEEKMTESKLYGTSKLSYQDIDSARLIIKHTESVDQELAAGRTRKIGSIYIESSEGERFKYPYKHLTGARAMARHVAEGGNAYDDFGKHIVSMSEEMSKLRKFKTYMGRSAVMAESLAGYVDVVKERIATVKKTLESLQRPSYYKETFEAFAPAVMEDVPSDVAENWIDQLTIRQFNEELADVFPYIYKLVSEATRAEELTVEDLVDEGEKHGNSKEYDKCWDGYKKVPGKKRGEKGSCVKEEDELEQGFEEMMGQFAEGNDDNTDEDNVQEAMIKTPKDASDALGVLRGKGKKIETGDGEYDGNLANEYASEVWDVYSWIEARTSGFQGIDPKFQEAIDAMMELRKEAKKLETQPGSGKNGKFGNQIVNTLYPVMQYIDAHDFDKKEDDDTMDAPKAKEQKTPLGEFILSYFDRETGQFPKGETAILTMVEKDYGDEYIEPAKQFIEMINNKVAEMYGYRDTDMQFDEGNEEFDRIRELAGLR